MDTNGREYIRRDDGWFIRALCLFAFMRGLVFASALQLHTQQKTG
jgi:hypothetical protein